MTTTAASQAEHLLRLVQASTASNILPLSITTTFGTPSATRIRISCTLCDWSGYAADLCQIPAICPACGAYALLINLPDSISI